MAKFLMLSKDHATTSLIRSRQSTVVRWVFRTLNTNRESRVEELDVTTANIVINSKCCWASAPSPYSLTCGSCPHKLTSQDWNCNKDFILCFFWQKGKEMLFLFIMNHSKTPAHEFENPVWARVCQRKTQPINGASVLSISFHPPKSNPQTRVDHPIDWLRQKFV